VVNREKILSVAAAQNGVKEDPPNSNLVKYNEWYYGHPTGVPWCCTSVSWIFKEAGYPLPEIQERGIPGAAYVPYVYDFYKKWSTPEKPKFTSHPKGADLVIYDWNKDGAADHIGIFVDWVVPGKSFHAWEGNTSPSNDSNGGEFMLRLRYVSQVQAFIDADLAV
jgi:hypothetical protein